MNTAAMNSSAANTARTSVDGYRLDLTDVRNRLELALEHVVSLNGEQMPPSRDKMANARRGEINLHMNRLAHELDWVGNEVERAKLLLRNVYFDGRA